VEQFSPRSKAILEIQSGRDLDILEKIYSNSVLLGDDGPNGWGIQYSREFDMTNDSKLFPPRPKWEEKGYRPDEYSRWLKGNWRPIDELWAELGVEPLKEGETRCAQPPYDRLPVPRVEIPVSVILSREGDAWVDEEEIEDTALPLYEGRMIGQFDFSQKGWVSGTGRGAVWRDIEWENKQIEPQYLLCLWKWQELVITAYLKSFEKLYGENEAIEEQKRLTDSEQFSIWWAKHRPKVAFIDVTSATNTRTMFSAALSELPCGNSAPALFCDNERFLPAFLNSLVYDTVAKFRCGGVHLNWFVIEESALPKKKFFKYDSFLKNTLAISFGNSRMGEFWIKNGAFFRDGWKSCWAISETERLRLRCILDAIAAIYYGLCNKDVAFLLSDCDYPNPAQHAANPKGFWRVDKDKPPELRHTVLTLVAFHDLEEKIRQCGGDRDKGIADFLNQNDGEGWMLPETLRLADYGLGHDDRAREHQPVASRLGPRFYDWQLAQSPEESWRECHLHARNLLGREGYFNLLGEVLRDTEAGRWEEALQFACDLEEKESLLRVFGAAFGFLAPGLWQDRREEALQLAQHRGFSLEPEDWVAVMVRALQRVPEDHRAEGLAAARRFVGESWFETLLERLMPEIPQRSDHPWHQVIRQVAGDALYQKSLAPLAVDGPEAVCETRNLYGDHPGKMTQGKLFE
jgi:hypothetical protein